MMEKVGVVSLLQVQPASIKQGDGVDESYHPEGLMHAERVIITSQGISGVTGAGIEVLDVHHPQHPLTRFRGANGLSVGFTSHYRAMQERFGPHMTVGCAAENIIVETESLIPPERLQHFLLVHNRASDRWVVLTNGVVAAPCLPFARFAAEYPKPASVIKQSLQFLNGGMRGYYFSLAPDRGEGIVERGDPVWLADEIPQVAIARAANADVSAWG